ncbi:molybdopterin oxidoreductase [Amycolatopsis vancoresmycina]|uniref:Molybdopterin oxidoreductase n=1 Tax=Amycolatopsis vancoresmycina DSM 44592 TaxID=1292037 RepID=R1HSS9_9PSEU|nr:molybdopterin oxidoreductase [Amycolatopsis vancoresmycina]EOD66625.1 molybdopterin oxidoreductase [Amycolatopsis vancoresmycina DSM 44592]
MASEVATFCPLCVSRCGATATVENGRLLALKPLPGHPTGQAIDVFEAQARTEEAGRVGRELTALKASLGPRCARGG